MDRRGKWAVRFSEGGDEKMKIGGGGGGQPRSNAREGHSLAVQ
jgi:hypothetical protein